VALCKRIPRTLALASSPGPNGRARATGRPRTSLPREIYLRAVDRVKGHIAAGDIYQANLTQRLTAPFDGDAWTLYRALASSTPAPRSAFVEVAGLALASVSPEMFVDADPCGRAETRPIKGTRPRGATSHADAAAAAALASSEKDRAELVMIVDVLRNDLGRVATTGSVEVPEPAALHSYPAVHHLVARVTADLAPGVPMSELVAAVFPGGSITGAPKIRAIELLREIEPVPRGLYTGSLFWLDDDGSLASSILIRSAVVSNGEVAVGAGGGIVADSEAEAEWSESNAKARAITRVLGFEPEEAA
jgi:para-aminobenzoate synthetase component 1